MSSTETEPTPKVKTEKSPRQRGCRKLRVYCRRFWKNTEKFSHIAQILFLALGAIWAFYVFIYDARIVPSQQPPQVTVSGELEQVGRKDGLVAVKAKLSVKNPGKSRAIFLAAFYNLIGYKLNKLEAVEATDQQYIGRLNEKRAVKEESPCNFYGPEINASRYYRKGEETFINGGNLLIGSWLDPDDQYTREYVFYVPEENYDLVQLQFNTYVTKDYQLIKWQNVEDHMRAVPEVCPNGKLSAHLEVKDYCRFCDLGTEEWAPLNNKSDEYKRQLYKERDYLQQDVVIDLPLMPNTQGTPVKSSGNS